MNPRIQVEHTVTEEITDVDLVQAQMRIASGESLADLGLSQDDIRINGAALQCRITTEDPANGFRPDTGTITAYRTAGGAGVRLDGGTVDTGVEISAHFDSMLVKLTCRGRTFEAAVARARRALAEFRIRGVSTNIPFLQAVLEDPDFIAGDVSTAFIEQRPELLTTHAPADRGTKLLRWLAEVTVNQPYGDAPTLLDPGVKRPAGIDLTVPSPQGSRQRLLELGPEGFAADLRAPGRRRGHRHHLPRRPPVAAGHPGPDQGPAADRPVRGPDDPRAVLGRVLGRGDLRRGAAVHRRGPVGTAGGAALQHARAVPADAAARAQHRRLHPVPDQGDHLVRGRGGRGRASTSSGSSTP